MVLTRSDSSQSAWFMPHSDDEGDAHDQRRIRHLSAVLIRNLTLDHKRDQLSAALFGQPALPPLDSASTAAPDGPAFGASVHLAADDFEFNASTAKGKGRATERRRRAGSTASWTGSLGIWDKSAQERELVLDAVASPAPVRTRPRRSSSATTLLMRTPGIKEEDSDVEPPSSPASTSAAPFAPSSQPLHGRSASRASIASNGTSHSASTIRQAPRLPPPPTSSATLAKERPPSSSQFAAKEKQRRTEALKRRLVDSFITLELIPPGQRLEGPPSTAKEGRRRGNSVAMPSMRRSGSAGSISGLVSPRERMRRRTVSSSLVPSTSSSSTSSASSSPSPPPQPFFVSHPAFSSMHPTFPIDHSAFLVPNSSDLPSPFPDDPSLKAWPGLREDRLRVKVFVRPREEGSNSGAKGKEGAREGEGGRDESWRLLVEWDVELDGLVSLGRDPTAFPPLPPNTLVFALSPSSTLFPSAAASSSASTTDVEYFTAPLSHLHRSSARHARAHSLSRSLSDDERDYLADSGSADEGNLSDPGVGGVGRSLRTRRDGRKRLVAERVRADEERRKKIALVERTRRETRMVKAAQAGDVRRLWEMEREWEGVVRETEGLRRRVEEELEGEEDGWAALQREKAERADRVEDLYAVRAEMGLELDEVREELESRKDALRARRARLKAARELDAANRARLHETSKDLDRKERTISSLRSSARTRRIQLITLLSHIFPIDPVLPSPSSPSPPALLFSILSLPLPNSTYPASYSDELLSSALGYAAQVTQTLAAYLGVPLCYPIQCRGSRSVVTDEISMMKGPRAFPLYGKGVDRYRFDYGVFLLNKNIEQLMYSQGLTVLDLRNTLPNLKSLILSLSYDPSHSDYLSSTLLPPPLFAAAPADDAPAEGSSTRARTPSPSSSSSADSADGHLQGPSTESTPSSTPETSTASLPAEPSHASSRPCPRPGTASNNEDGTPARASPSPPPPGSRTLSRSPSLASTIRAPRSERSDSPTPTVRERDEGKRASSSERGGRSARANGGEANGSTGNGAEKKEPTATATATATAAAASSSRVDRHADLKTKLEGRSRAGSGGSTASSGTGTGYGSRIASGLWSAVASYGGGGGGGGGLPAPAAAGGSGVAE
ncbi:hypothetical protein JCM5296_000947 [Sporobolomyces johnsonii]